MPTNPSTQTISLFAPVPPPVFNASATYTGKPFPGSQPIYYWIVARYPAGLSPPFGPIAVPGTPGIVNLNASNKVLISWIPAPGATSYDVIRRGTPFYPVVCNTCAISLANTGTTYEDTGGVGTVYPPPGLPVADNSRATIQLDNILQDESYFASSIDGVPGILPRTIGNPVLGNLAKWGKNGRTLLDSGLPYPVPDSASQPYIVIGGIRLGPINNASVPDSSNFAFGNQAGTVLNQSQGSWHFSFLGETSMNVTRYVAPLPSPTHCVITAGFRCLTINAGGSSRLGVGVREASTERIIFLCQCNASSIQVARYKGDNNLNALMYDFPMTVSNVWVRIVSSPLLLSFFISLNGTDFILLNEDAPNAFFDNGPDEYGVFGDNGVGVDGAMTALELFSLTLI